MAAIIQMYLFSITSGNICTVKPQPKNTHEVKVPRLTNSVSYLDCKVEATFILKLGPQK